SKTSNKEETSSEPVQTRPRMVGVFLCRWSAAPVFNGSFQPQAGRDNRSQAQRGSQQPAFSNCPDGPAHDLWRTRRAVYVQRLGSPASSVSPEVPAAVLCENRRAADYQI